MLTPSTNCPLGPCVKLLAGAWTLEIIFHLKDSTMHFGGLKRILGKISAKVLSARLKELEARGIIDKHETEDPQRKVEYQLTSLGRELIPILDLISEISVKLKNKYPDEI